MAAGLDSAPTNRTASAARFALPAYGYAYRSAWRFS
jgi:hypothetical protein